SKKPGCPIVPLALKVRAPIPKPCVPAGKRFRGTLRAIAIVLYPAKLSRPRVSWLGSGVPARTEAVNRLNAGMSKKNGSSVMPAKNLMPVVASVVTVCGGAVAAIDEIVVGAVRVSSRVIDPVMKLMVAVCGEVRDTWGLN